MPCRIARRKLWMHRIMLEATCHSDNCFLTLTYSELMLPSTLASIGRDPASLRRKHLQDWLKRLRKEISPLRIRFYACGEYGDKSWRPHYHVCLFGYPTCVLGRTLREPGSDRALAYKCCAFCQMLQATWPWGDVDLGTLTKDSASYCAGYTVKRMTRLDDPRLVENGISRMPEFGAMSLRPGIGADAMWDVASEMIRYRLDDTMEDVPSSIAYGRRKRALGRYLRNKLRVMIGREEGASGETLAAMEAELLPLREAARSSSSQPSFKREVIKDGESGAVNLMSRIETFRKRRPL